ncbi:MAG: hypothetical protein AAB602_02650 [Patescibacteria group bacterium]
MKRIIHSPKRVEEGIAPKTVAVMQAAGSAKHPYELWAMVQRTRQGTSNKGQVTKVISAWRYPGVTKPRSEIVLLNARKEFSEFSGKMNEKEANKVRVTFLTKVIHR